MSLIIQIPYIGIPFKTRQVFGHKKPISWVFAVTNGLAPLRKNERISEGTKQFNVHFYKSTREFWSKRPYHHQNTM